MEHLFLYKLVQGNWFLESNFPSNHRQFPVDSTHMLGYEATRPKETGPSHSDHLLNPISLQPSYSLEKSLGDLPTRPTMALPSTAHQEYTLSVLNSPSGVIESLFFPYFPQETLLPLSILSLCKRIPTHCLPLGSIHQSHQLSSWASIQQNGDDFSSTQTLCFFATFHLSSQAHNLLFFSSPGLLIGFNYTL